MAQKTAVALPDGEGERVARPRTTIMQRTLVLMLRDASPDLSLKAIADQVGISESSVRRCLAYRTEDVKASTRQLLQTMIPEAAGFWFKAAKTAAAKGYHQPSKDLIEAAGGIDAKPTSSVTVDARPTFVLNVPYKLGALQHYQPDATAIDAEHVKQPALPEPKP